MQWPGQQPTIEITLPLPAPQPAPPAYSSSTGWSDRINHLEAEVRRLGAIVEELKQQQQQQPARRPRRWYQRVVETWSVVD